jgi:hypothetical protein
MSRGEISGGLVSGMLQGYKTGFALSKMESGIKKGFTNGLTRHDKIQDPSLLEGSKKPVVFWLADLSTATGTTLTGLTNNVLGGGAITVSSSPLYVYNGFLNNRAYINMDTANDIIYTPFSNNKNEITIMMLIRLSNSINNQYLFSKVSSNAANTIGDLRIYSMGGNRVRVEMYGNPTSTLSVYDTFTSDLAGVVEGKGWSLLTVKCRLYQPQGQGSEVEIYVNGSLNMTPITNTFGGSTSNFSNGNNLIFGNGPVVLSLTGISSGGGSNIAGAVVYDYWLNSAEQIRNENFFRWYYGYEF